MGFKNFLKHTRCNNRTYKLQKIKSVKLSWNNINFELVANSKCLTAYYLPPQKDIYTLQGIPNTQSVLLNETEFNTYISQAKKCLENVPVCEEYPVLGLPGASLEAYMWCKYASKDLYYTNTFSEEFSLRRDPVNEEFIQLYDMLKAKFNFNNLQ